MECGTRLITLAGGIDHFKGRFGDSTGAQLSALMGAGLVLFGMTLVVNTIAGFVVARSRSGAATEI